MRTHALALGVAARRSSRSARCNKDNGKTANGAPKAQTEKAQKIAGTKTIAAGLAPTAGSWPRRRPRASTRPSRPGTLHGLRSRRRRLQRRSGWHVRRQAAKSAAADGHPHQSDPARHGDGRRHRQGDRQRQGQGPARDDGRRHADRHQGRRQDRPHRFRRPQGDDHARATSNIPTASSITSTRVLMPAKPAASARRSARKPANSRNILRVARAHPPDEASRIIPTSARQTARYNVP